MSFQTLAWLAMAAYALHVMEEFFFDWRDWARSVIGLPVEWGDFYVTNSVVVAIGIAQAELANSLPLATLAFAALMVINALFFHILPMVLTRGRYSPGVFTAVVLLLPLGLAVFLAASKEGLAGPSGIIAAFAIGAALMAYPIIMIRLRSLPYFRQT